MKKIAKTTKLLGLTLFSSDKKQLLNLLEEKLSGRSGLVTIATPNPEQVIQSRQTTSFAQALEQFDLLLPDGTGLIWASRVLQKSATTVLPERIAGVDVVHDLLSYAQQHAHTVLVIGGRGYGGEQEALATPGQTVGARNQQPPVDLQPAYPNLSLPSCFWLPGFRDVTRQTPVEQEQIAVALQTLRPAVVFVAFGAPHQELWVQAHRELLAQSGVQVAMVVGGAFDYILGKVPRAPQLLQRSGLEWAYRLVMQPWRWRRQLRLVQFVWLVFRTRLAG